MEMKWIDLIPVDIAKWLGHILVGIAVVGVIIPILPTVPFLILAMLFYTRGAPQHAEKLRTHPRLGIHIQNWEKRGAISLVAKMLALAMIGGSGVAMWFMVGNVVVKSLALLTLVVVSIFIVTRPSR